MMSLIGLVDNASTVLIRLNLESGNSPLKRSTNDFSLSLKGTTTSFSSLTHGNPSFPHVEIST